jgi:hypothetical protein
MDKAAMHDALEEIKRGGRGARMRGMPGYDERMAAKPGLGLVIHLVSPTDEMDEDDEDGDEAG